MSGSLVLIQETVVTSAVSAVTLTGISSSFNVYQVVFNNVAPETDAQVLKLRVTTSGTPDSDSEYDSGIMFFKSAGGFVQTGLTNQDHFPFDTSGTTTGEELNGTLHLFNFQNSSEFSFATVEVVSENSSSAVRSQTGGFYHSVNEANDGVSFFFNSGNIASGKFQLFGLVK
ncbi:putative glycoprotein [uncultured Mediterranean phage uvMED]|jgi:hypothetical protein|nr:putative glycoprotein [uncultured Mediterranean phage uvMED]BAR14784.1 putative glycoprotein [uncultured Mediterranean phage uvMED]|tara:strand:- start:710 stop:1225 length:516 start_codon:yes stop_codon:yes gene_type:complete